MSDDSDRAAVFDAIMQSNEVGRAIGEKSDVEVAELLYPVQGQPRHVRPRVRADRGRREAATKSGWRAADARVEQALMDYDEEPPVFCRNCEAWRKAAVKRDERILTLEKSLAASLALLEQALCLADEWTNARWLIDVQTFMAQQRKGP